MKRRSYKAVVKTALSAALIAGLILAAAPASAQRRAAAVQPAAQQTASPSTLLKPARVFDAEDGKVHALTSEPVSAAI